MILEEITTFINTLYKRIIPLLDEVYEDAEVREDIQRFANYNFNRTLKNLGIAEVFTGEEVEFHSALEAEVKNGLDVTHDIFSLTSNVYFMMEAENFDEVHENHIQEKITTRSRFAPKARRA